jgi:hypothetical protein
VVEDDVQNVFITTRMWQKMNVLPYHAPQLLPYHGPRHLAHVHSAEEGSTDAGKDELLLIWTMMNILQDKFISV